MYAALLDEGEVGAWAEALVRSPDAIAPDLMLAEVGEALRRSVLRGNVSSDVATLAYGDLLELRLGLFAYEIVADRAWELRGNLTLYDAWYVALAEAVGTELATLDARLARAPGPRCGFVLPEPAGA